MRSRNSNYDVSKTVNGTFKVRFYDEEGKRRRKNVKTATDRDNLIRAIKRRESLERWFPTSAVLPKRALHTFGDLSNEFLKHRKDVKEISVSCLCNYETQLRQHILPIFQNIKLDVLHLNDIEKLASKLKITRPKTKSYSAVRKELFAHDEFLSAGYRREILTLACVIVKFGFERDLIDRHPFKAFKMPGVGDRPFDYWRPEEEDRFLDWLEAGGEYYLPHTHRSGERYDRRWTVWNHHLVYEIVLTALKTGMRKGEIGGLTMDDVSFNDNIITIRSSYCEKENRYKNTTKNGSFRRIEMNPDVRDILMNYRHLPGNRRIFKVNTHTLKKFSKLTRYAGVREIHFHALRHTFLTNIANGFGMDEPVHILKVKDLAGHSNLETTMLYVHNDGIKDTNSRMWSRSERKSRRIKLVREEDAKEA